MGQKAFLAYWIFFSIGVFHLRKYCYIVMHIHAVASWDYRPCWIYLSYLGILNTFGEVLVGWVGDQPWVSTPALYAICMCCCGLSTALMPLVSSYPLVLGNRLFFTVLIPTFFSLSSFLWIMNLYSLYLWFFVCFSAVYGLCMYPCVSRTVSSLLVLYLCVSRTVSSVYTGSVSLCI